MDTNIDARTERGTLAEHQAIRRSAREAARLKAAHRSFQRTATRQPFRKEEAIEPVWTLF